MTLANVLGKPLVYVEWYDSFSPEGWLGLEELDEEHLTEMLCMSVGWLIKESKTAVYVVPHVAPADVVKYGEDDPKGWNGDGVMGIPRVAVKRIVYLGEKKKPRTKPKVKKR
jgi:hypothetical protein